MDNLTKEMQYQVDAVYEELKTIYNGKAKYDDGEDYTIYDWFVNEVLDVEYTLNSQKELIGVRCYVTLGGPCVYVDTQDNCITCKWGSDTIDRWLPDEFSEMICDAQYDIWEN